MDSLNCGVRMAANGDVWSDLWVANGAEMDFWCANGNGWSDLWDVTM